jgi:hypothetical protein
LGLVSQPLAHCLASLLGLAQEAIERHRAESANQTIPLQVPKTPSLDPCLICLWIYRWCCS